MRESPSVASMRSVLIAQVRKEKTFMCDCSWTHLQRQVIFFMDKTF